VGDKEDETYAGGWCLGCGYALRDLAEDRCPECGRTFDRSEPKTIGDGTRLRGWKRLVMRPIGWHWVLLAIFGGGAALASTRWPLTWKRAFLDSALYWSVAHHASNLKTPTDWLFVLGATLALVLIVLWVLRLAMQCIIARTARLPRQQFPDQRRRHALIALGGAMAAVSVAFGGPFRVARRWVRPLLWSRRTAVTGPPVTVTPSEEVDLIRSALMQLPTVPERMAGLKLLIERRSDVAIPVILEALEREKHPEMIAWLLRILGMQRNATTIKSLEPYFDHPDPMIAASAIDAIGGICNFDVIPGGYVGDSTNSFPSIAVGLLRPASMVLATADQRGSLRRLHSSALD
jgi:hypothetical protein